MADANEKNESQAYTRKIDFKDLKTLLRKSLADEFLEIVEFTVSNFIPVGENFGSVMVKLDVTVTKGINEKPLKLHLVAKTIYPIDKPLICWKDAFKKEVFVYTELLPAYRDLEREVGVPESELINLIPKYYGHRLSLNENSDQVDDDSLFLMENMKMRGYYTGNKKTGLDLEHARTTVTAMARYHALGIALRQKRLELFKKVADLTKLLGLDIKQIDEGFLGVLENFRETPCFEKYLPMIELSFAGSINGKRLLTPSDEPWVTVTHGDLWVNNILFHKDDAGNIDDIKLIDFQIYLCSSPLKDLPHFLCASLEDETLIKHLDELLDLYYDKFITFLKRLGCSTVPFSRDNFERELKKQAFYEFTTCSLIRKFFAFEINSESTNAEVISSVFESGCSNAIKQKLQVLIDVYVKKGWF